MQTTTYECSCCGHDVEVNHDRLKDNPRVRCHHCRALYRVDTDAEFVDGSWRDLTKLWRV